MDLDVLDATIQSTDSRGYRFVAMSESWKTMCLDLPCSKRVQVPLLYKQQSLATTIDGEAVVIQAWKGDCPEAYREMPGGIGGEVGVYHVVPGRTVPTTLTLPRVNQLPAKLRPFVTRVVSKLIKDFVEVVEVGTEHWWPFPELAAEISMRFLHPTSGEVFFDAIPTEPIGGYWMSRWMHYDSYRSYQETNATPTNPYDYAMEFAVKGVVFRWDAPDEAIRCVSH